MTSPEKAKGDAFERAVVDYLQTHGHRYAQRAFGAGRRDDQGDVLGLPGVVLQVKNHRRLELAAWVDQAEEQRARARADLAVVVAKRRGKPAADSYVVLSLGAFARLLAELDQDGQRYGL